MFDGRRIAEALIEKLATTADPPTFRIDEHEHTVALRYTSLPVFHARALGDTEAVIALGVVEAIDHDFTDASALATFTFAP